MRSRASRFAKTVGAFLAFQMLVATLSVAFAQSSSERPRKLYRIGGRHTAISRESANTVADLQRLISRFESDLRTAFQASGWDGDPDAFFAAVAAGEVEKTSVPVGQRLEWMAFRKGEPTVMRNIEWAGDRPMDAWEVSVVNDVTRATFVIPALCLNTALVEEKEDMELVRMKEEAARPPTCQVRAAANCDAKSLSISASTEAAEVAITGLELGGAAQSLSGLSSTGSGQWSLSDPANGTYTITATATKSNGVTGTCSTRVEVDCPVAVCELAASYDADEKVINVSSAGSVGDVAIQSVTLPDGSAGNLEKVTDMGGGSWAFKPKRTLPRRTGSYTYEFDAVSNYEGETASCSATVTIDVEAPEDRWTLRLFGSTIDADGEKLATDETVIMNGEEVPKRMLNDLGDGSGFGLGLEYRATDLLGVELSALFGELNSNFVVDIGPEWGMDDDRVGITPITLGLNFHVLRPNGPVDLYLGPVVGIVLYDDAEYDALGQKFVRNFDDEFTWGLNLGLDVPFGNSPWLFNADVRYLDTSAKDDDSGLEFPVDPLIYSAGFGFRF